MQFKLFNKQRRHQRVMGLDLDDTQAHLLIAGKASPFAQLLALNTIDYADDMLLQGVATQPEKLAHSLRPTLTAYPIDSVALYIADEFIISDMITTPSDLTDEDLEAYITLELESRLSLSVAEIYFDFTAAENHSNDYIFVACNRKIVDSRIETMKMLGLSVNLVGIEKFLLANLHTRYQQHDLSTVELFKKWQIHPDVNKELLGQQTQNFFIAATLALETLCCSYI